MGTHHFRTSTSKLQGFTRKGVNYRLSIFIKKRPYRKTVQEESYGKYRIEKSIQKRPYRKDHTEKIVQKRPYREDREEKTVQKRQYRKDLTKKPYRKDRTV